MTNREASAAEIMGLEREASRRQSLRDFDWIIEQHAEEAVMFPPGAAALPSLDILRAAKQRTETETDATPRSEFSWEPTHAVISADDQMGYVYGVTTEKKVDDTVVIGKFLSIWVREGGSWKVKAEIRNEN